MGWAVARLGGRLWGSVLRWVGGCERVYPPTPNPAPAFYAPLGTPCDMAHPSQNPLKHSSRLNMGSDLPPFVEIRPLLSSSSVIRQT